MTNWQEEYCSQRPSPLDYANPNTYIQRKNIMEYEKTSPDNSVEKGWKCDSRFISVEEYNLLIAQEEISQGTNDNLLVSMAAQAEIYERLMAQEDNQLTIMAAIADLFEMQNGGV